MTDNCKSINPTANIINVKIKTDKNYQLLTLTFLSVSILTFTKSLDILELEKIKEILPEYIHQTSKQKLTLTEQLNYVLKEEINYKDSRATEGIIKAANFPFRKTLEDYDYSFQPSVNENQVKELTNLGFIEQHKNIIFVGNSGVGKTHLAVAIGIAAAKHRNSVYFITCHNLMLKLNKAQKENRLDKQLQHLAQYKLLIIYEIGYLPVDHQGSNLFFQLIAKRYMNKSTIVTTNMPFSKLYNKKNIILDLSAYST